MRGVERRLRIGYLCPSSDLYGTEVSLLATLRDLDQRRFEPVLVLMSDGLLSQEARASGIDVQVLPWLKMSRRPKILAVSTVFRFSRWLRTQRIAILELALWWQSLDLGLPVMTAKLAGVPFVFTNRLVMPSWLSLSEKMWLALADRIIAVSRASIEPALRPRRSDCLFRIRSERIAIIPSARSVCALQHVPPASAASLGIPTGARIVGMVAAIDARKRQSLFLQAAALVAKECPETRFVLVGSPYTNQPRGPAYRASLDQLVENLGLQRRVVFTGYRRDAIALMKLFDVLVLPSKSEAEGSVLIEAMAVGVPIVASAVDGIPEIVADGKTGLLIEGSEPEDYAAAILRLLKDQDYARAMRRAGPAHALLFDSSQVLRKVEACYEGLACDSVRAAS